jgi:hypothetical protein
MPRDLIISYVHNEKGRVDKEFDNVESFDCVHSTEREGKTLIVRHSHKSKNSTVYNVDSLIGSEER